MGAHICNHSEAATRRSKFKAQGGKMVIGQKLLQCKFEGHTQGRKTEWTLDSCPWPSIHMTWCSTLPTHVHMGSTLPTITAIGGESSKNNNSIFCSVQWLPGLYSKQAPDERKGTGEGGRGIEREGGRTEMMVHISPSASGVEVRRIRSSSQWRAPWNAVSKTKPKKERREGKTTPYLQMVPWIKAWWPEFDSLDPQGAENQILHTVLWPPPHMLTIVPPSPSHTYT